LCTGKTLAFLNSGGNIPVSCDLLKILQRGSAITGASTVRSLAEILSSPTAFLVERDFRASRTDFQPQPSRLLQL